MKQNENQNIQNLAKNNAFIAFIYLDATLIRTAWVLAFS
jgi:hypothetical protein